jgi:hypothetical protein
VFIAALFVIMKKWKKFKYSSPQQEINKRDVSTWATRTAMKEMK